MNLMLGHNQQLDLSNPQILNLQPKIIALSSKKKHENSNNEFKIVKQHICLDL